MRQESHVQFCEGAGVKLPRATRLVVHCRSKAEAEQMRHKIGERLERCGLQLHPEKTRVVCCRPDIVAEQAKRFDFLGFTFQPRVAKSRTGQIFVSFGPAISDKAKKRIRATMRRTWHVPRRTKMSLNELAVTFNPTLDSVLRPIPSVGIGVGVAGTQSRAATLGDAQV
jgi:RNA-directed DNA polymerase